MPLYTCGMAARNNAPHMWAHQNSGPRATSCLPHSSQSSGRRLSVWSEDGEVQGSYHVSLLSLIKWLLALSPFTPNTQSTARAPAPTAKHSNHSECR